MSLMEMTGIVLAGGKSHRLGRNKATTIFNGTSLIQHVVQRLKTQASRVLIVTSRDQSNLPVDIDAEVMVDLYPEKGPLGGIYTGLMQSRSSRNIVVACDMPFLNTNLLGYLVKLSSKFDAVVPRLEEGKLEPLHAIYSRKCLSSIRLNLEAGGLEAYSFFNMISVRYVELAECQRFDPQLLSFFNINRQSDLEQAVLVATNNDYGLKATHDAASVLIDTSDGPLEMQ